MDTVWIPRTSNLDTYSQYHWEDTLHQCLTSILRATIQYLVESILRKVEAVIAKGGTNQY